MVISILGCSDSSSDDITPTIPMEDSGTDPVDPADPVDPVDPDPVDPADPTPSSVQVSTYASILAPDGLTIDSNGILFAASYGTSKVYKIDTDQSVSLFAENQPGAAGMIFNDQGKLYLARYNVSDIVELSDQGVVTQTIATNVLGTIALALDDVGNVYTNNNVNNAVTKIDPSGAKLTISHSIYNNSSVTLDADNNMYVSDYVSGQIIKIDAQTNAVSSFVNLPINGGVGFIIYVNGVFYATAIADHVVYKIDAQGNAEIIAGSKGIAGSLDGNGDEARLNTPNGIVASADGNTLYVAQGGSGSIRMITGF
ncbi:virginiamycin B lyase [Kordia sp. SMS9]|uniref:hypothetical protein n=1 Tax=Kordia sp. SMS9 TaxID=2282170 RepID=UPI000E104416|nr:hypothetical protein [Kordia sp. SMS9]AXG69740.1 virginiamycin B lyase [Kordia sp. SMS9]